MDRLKLFTLQSYDLTKFRGPIRLELGTYRNDPRIIAAQRELNARLHENQLIWMSQTYPYLSSNHLGHFVNEVNVTTAILQQLSTAWSGITLSTTIRDTFRQKNMRHCERKLNSTRFKILRLLCAKLKMNTWDDVYQVTCGPESASAQLSSNRTKFSCDSR